MKNKFWKPLIILVLLLVYQKGFCLDINLINPKERITAETLGIIVNTADPQSVKVAEYYVSKREIPKENIISVNFKVKDFNMTADDFIKLKHEIDTKTPSHIQAYAITWTSPYRVDCMSMTSAMAFGFDRAYCGGCTPTKASPYFNANTSQPFNEFKMRPTMMLAGENTESVFKLIDTGVSADSTFPSGDAYLAKGDNGAYSVRSRLNQQTQKTFSSVFRTYIHKPIKPPLKRSNILFYFEGAPVIENMHLFTFLPGAIADHLTSFGGDILNKEGQTKAIKWLNAGATASYGTVLEPCNYTQKFPVPAIVMYHYLNGASLIEAYWRSVEWPGEGLFIGEPLAAPFAPTIVDLEQNSYALKLFAKNNGVIKIFDSKGLLGPYQKVSEQIITQGNNHLVFKSNKNMIGEHYFKYEIQYQE